MRVYYIVDATKRACDFYWYFTGSAGGDSWSESWADEHEKNPDGWHKIQKRDLVILVDFKSRSFEPF